MADAHRRDADASSSESEGRRRRKGQTRSEHDRRPRGGAVDLDEHRSGDFKRESRVSRSKEDRHSHRHRRRSDEGSDKEGRGRTRRHEDRRHRHNDSGSDEDDRHDRHSRRERKRISSSDEEGIFRGRERPRGDDRMHGEKDRHNGKEDAKGRREDGEEEALPPPPPSFPPMVPEADSAKGRVRRHEDSRYRRSDSRSGEDDRHDRHRRRERKRISSSDDEEGIFRGRERPRGDDPMRIEKDRRNGKEDAKGRREDGKEEKALPPPPPFPPSVPEANSAKGRVRRYEDSRHRRSDSGSGEDDRPDRHSRRKRKRISSSDEEEGIFRGGERPRGDDRMHREKYHHNGKEDAKGRIEDSKEEEALPPPPPFPPLAPQANSAKGRVRRYEDSRHRRSDSGSGEDDRPDRHSRRERKRISSSDEEEGIFRGGERPRGDDRMHREKYHHNGKEDAKGRIEDSKEEALPPPPPFPPLAPQANSAKGRVRRYEDSRHRRSDSGSGDDDGHNRRRKRERKRVSSSDEEEGIFRGRERPRGDDHMHREKDRHNGKEDAQGRREYSKEEEALPPPPPFPPLVPEANSGRSGGIYIPPFRMAQMLKDVSDKSGEAYQRLSWDALRKSINGLVNKVNATNIKNIIPELFSENLIRGRGLFCRSCMKSQMASPAFTDVFAALVAVVNTKFPEVGKLLLKRIVLQLKRAYKRNDKPQLLAATKFIAHLVNQQVAHEIVALELLTVLLENPTVDSVEVAVGFVKECGALLQDFSSKGLHGIFERFRGILHEGEIEKRVGYLIEELFAIRKAKFQGFPAIRPELDLVEQEDQLTHETSLEDEIDPETHLDVFKPNPQFLDDEKVYEDLKKNILGADSSEEEGSESASDEEDEEESEEEEEQMKIKDETETNLINLRRTIYLTIMSSVDFEEAGHKLLKIKLEPGQEMELCIMLLECCSQERTYLRYYGLLGQRFCMINKVYQENFETCFVQQYSMIHRLETNKLRNVAKFFAHLLGTSALPWHVLSYIRLTEEDTTSSSRIFIKILFQELSEHLGIRLLNERLNEPTMKDSFESIFPKDNPKNTRFSINFFTSIGLGGITESLREYLKSMPSRIMQQQKPVPGSEDESESNGTSSSDSSSSDSDTGSDSETDSSSDERNKRSSKRKRRN